MDGMTTGAAGTSVAEAGSHLAAALAAGGTGLRIDLQPICAAANLAPVGYEALLRWDHPELGPVPPLETFAIAEAAGRLVALDAWALVHAFRLRAGWPAGGPYLAVNVSAGSIKDGHAAPMVRAALEATGADPRGVVLELPEAAVMRDIDAARTIAARLRGLGAAVALDDFGGQHGAARLLRDIPFASVKLDAALTEGVDAEGPASDRARAMVGAVVDMVHAMGATVTAEAVETAAQMRALRQAGCDALQGWLLGRPGPMA
jgi:EAL domain-containing protein (putative c-di-GMP-specific phosphodiesterase class I)